MPQGRHKTPFSGKQKKEQLKEKRKERTRSRSKQSSENSDGEDPSGSGGNFYGNRRNRNESKNRAAIESELGEVSVGLTAGAIAKINAQPDSNSKRDANRYALHFFRESDAELSKRKKEASEPFVKIPPEGLEVKSEDVWPPNELGMPKRPPWDFKMNPQQLDMRENQYFRQYLEKIESEYSSLTNLSHFELNLETWRQLWRVLEMADIILLVTDIRHPIFHFPPALYSYVTHDLKKDFIIVLNKCDLIPAPLVVAWIDYFKKRYPEIHVVPFASYAGMKMRQSGKSKAKRVGSLKMAAEGCKRLFKVCEGIVKKEVDINSWLEKIESELKEAHDTDDDESGEPETTEQKIEKKDTSFYQNEKYKDGILSIGCVGHPNVGKSSVLNAVMGRKVVSVSRTPGHTKYFQTIFITPNVKLVDCPGLVFPSKIPKAMQVLMGCFPIAQLREPYSAILYMAQRIDIPKILGIIHPDPEKNVSIGQQKWSAFDVCEAWAIKRGFKTAKAARPDVYRAANHLLRMALDGRTLCLSFYPDNYVRDREVIYEGHPDVNSILVLQNQRKSDEDDDDYFKTLDDDDDDTHDDEALPRGASLKGFKSGRSSAGDKKDESEDEEEEDGDEDETDVATSRKPTKPSVFNKFALLADDD